MRDKITERVFERLLTEIDLGVVEFSPVRSDGASNMEPNTPEETAVYDQLDMWISGDEAANMQGPGGAEDILRLMSHPKYSRFFKEAQGGTEVYRGIAATREQLARMVRVPVASLPPSGELDVTFTAAPRRHAAAASWTYDEELAATFAALRATRRAPVHVVWTAAVDDNPGAFLDLWSIVGRSLKNRTWKNYSREAEVLALRPVTACHVKWWDVSPS